MTGPSVSVAAVALERFGHGPQPGGHHLPVVSVLDRHEIEALAHRVRGAVQHPQRAEVVPAVVQLQAGRQALGHDLGRDAVGVGVACGGWPSSAKRARCRSARSSRPSGERSGRRSSCPGTPQSVAAIGSLAAICTM